MNNLLCQVKLITKRQYRHALDIESLNPCSKGTRQSTPSRFLGLTTHSALVDAEAPSTMPLKTVERPSAHELNRAAFYCVYDASILVNGNPEAL